MTEESPTLVSLGRGQFYVSGRGKHLVWHHHVNAEAKGAGLPAPSHNSTLGQKFPEFTWSKSMVPCSSSLTCLFSHQKLITHHHHTLWQDYAKLGERRELTELVSFSLPAACWKGNEPCGALPRLSHHLEPLLHCHREGGDTDEGQELWWADNNVLTLIILVKMRLCGYRMYATYS